MGLVIEFSCNRKVLWPRNHWLSGQEKFIRRWERINISFLLDQWLESAASLACVSSFKETSDLPTSVVFWEMREIRVLKQKCQSSSICSPVKAANWQALPRPSGSETVSACPLRDCDTRSGLGNTELEQRLFPGAGLLNNVCFCQSENMKQEFVGKRYTWLCFLLPPLPVFSDDEADQG